MKNKDFFTCVALFGAFKSEEVKKAFENEEKVRKWNSFIGELVEFTAGTTWEAKENLKNFLKDKATPLAYNFFFNSCTSLKEKFFYPIQKLG